MAYSRSHASFPYVLTLFFFFAFLLPLVALSLPYFTLYPPLSFSLILSPAIQSSTHPNPPGPEVEARIDAYRAKNGPVLFGGRLKSSVDQEADLAIPDNLGANLVDEPVTQTQPRT
jgi:hypothetical protein